MQAEYAGRIIKEGDMIRTNKGWKNKHAFNNTPSSFPRSSKEKPHPLPNHSSPPLPTIGFDFPNVIERCHLCQQLLHALPNVLSRLRRRLPVTSINVSYSEPCINAALLADGGHSLLGECVLCEIAFIDQQNHRKRLSVGKDSLLPNLVLPLYDVG